MTGIELGIKQIGAEIDHAIIVDTDTGTLYRSWIEWHRSKLIHRVSSYPDQKICCKAKGYDTPELRDSVPPEMA